MAHSLMTYLELIVKAIAGMMTLWFILKLIGIEDWLDSIGKNKKFLDE